MRIHVQFPETMKMSIDAWVEIDEARTLREVKEKIFAVFRQALPYYPCQGVGQLILLDEHDLFIVNDEELRRHLAGAARFAIAVDRFRVSIQP